MSIIPVGPGSILPVAGGIGQTSQAQAGKPSFAQMIENLLGDANTQQIQADQAVQQLALGRTDNVHDVMLALAKADMSFRTVLEIRNRLTEAYQEVMRMQI
jgi:flagellar hook-basal body complex protein FliE